MKWESHGNYWVSGPWRINRYAHEHRAWYSSEPKYDYLLLKDGQPVKGFGRLRDAQKHAAALEQVCA